MLPAICITTTNVDDAAAAATELFSLLADQTVSKVRHKYADSKYHNQNLNAWVAENTNWELTIVRRPKGTKGWVLLPIRWTVERTFAWLDKCRRLSLDREKTVLFSESFIRLSMIRLMLNRVRPKADEAFR